jgi:hypothetical protein
MLFWSNFASVVFWIVFISKSDLNFLCFGRMTLEKFLEASLKNLEGCKQVGPLWQTNSRWPGSSPMKARIPPKRSRLGYWLPDTHTSCKWRVPSSRLRTFLMINSDTSSGRSTSRGDAAMTKRLSWCETLEERSFHRTGSEGVLMWHYLLFHPHYL